MSQTAPKGATRSASDGSSSSTKLRGTLGHVREMQMYSDNNLRKANHLTLSEVAGCDNQFSSLNHYHWFVIYALSARIHCHASKRLQSVCVGVCDLDLCDLNNGQRSSDFTQAMSPRYLYIIMKQPS